MVVACTQCDGGTEQHRIVAEGIVYEPEIWQLSAGSCLFNKFLRRIVQDFEQKPKHVIVRREMGMLLQEFHIHLLNEANTGVLGERGDLETD